MNKHLVFAPASLLILAGGRSRRFGEDKSQLRINGMLVAQMLIERLKGLFEQILISSDRPGKFDLPGVLEVVDEYSGKGPLGGVHAGMKACSKPWVFVLACDMPAIERNVVEEMLSAASATTAQAIIPKHDAGYEPLCAMYSCDAFGTIEALITQGGRPGMLDLLNKLDVVYLKTDNCYFNVNTPEDAARIQLQKQNSASQRKPCYDNYFQGQDK